MAKRSIEPQIGDIFAIPLPDGDVAIGQVVARIEELGCVGCALFSLKHRSTDLSPTLKDPISVQIVAPDLLKRRYWPILDNRPANVSSIHFHWEDHRDAQWVGVKIVGSGIIREFMQAYHGFIPWDAMADQEYFTKLLAKGVRRPPTAYAAGA